MKIARAGGFTLIEMMMALVVLAVLLAVAAPGFYELIKNNRMLSQVYAMRAALNGARSEALAQRAFVTVCRSGNGKVCCEENPLECEGNWNWKQGYIAFVDINGDGLVSDPNSPAGDRVFISKVEDSDTLDISYSSAKKRIRIDGQGYAREFDGVFTFCDIRREPAARRLEVTPMGVVRALDPNDPPTPLKCP